MKLLSLPTLLHAVLTSVQDESGCRFTYGGQEVDVLEITAPNGLLPLLAAQAQHIASCCDPASDWLPGLSFIDDPRALTGRRAIIDETKIQDRVSYLLFFLDAAMLAKEHTPYQDRIDLAALMPPIEPGVFRHLGILSIDRIPSLTDDLLPGPEPEA